MGRMRRLSPEPAGTIEDKKAGSRTLNRKKQKQFNQAVATPINSTESSVPRF